MKLTISIIALLLATTPALELRAEEPQEMERIVIVGYRTLLVPDPMTTDAFDIWLLTFASAEMEVEWQEAAVPTFEALLDVRCFASVEVPRNYDGYLRRQLEGRLGSANWSIFGSVQL